MTGDTWLAALRLALVIEGVMPLLAPGGWRRTVSQLMQLRDGQLRFFGLCAVGAGLLLIWLV